MAIPFPIEAHRARDGPRWTIGVLVSSACNRVTAAAVAAVGEAVAMRAEIAGVSSCQVPKETAALFGQLTSASVSPTDSDSPGRITSLAAQLAEVEAQLVGNLLSGGIVGRNQLLAVGVHDPGLWSRGRAMPGGYVGLCVAARLAELTNLSVIDAFPARDLARGGQGGPITALAEWILLRAPDRNRLLLDLGRSVRMSYLPRERGDDPAGRILSFEAGPGTRMLDRLTQRLTSGGHDFDPGGRLAVQGRRIPKLLEHWLSDPYFRRPLPKWQPRGVQVDRFLGDALRMAVDSGWSVRDLLCTATHLIAETIASAMRQRLPSDERVDEVMLTGGGQHNGMLLREIATRLPDVPILRIGQPEPGGEALGAGCIALLALLHIDQVPGNHSAVTGTELPRVLGRLTPGPPQSWQRLLSELKAKTPPARRLRAAS